MKDKVIESYNNISRNNSAIGDTLDIFTQND